MSYNKRFFHIAKFLLFMLLLSGCEFDPDEVPFTDIECPSDPPPISFTINNYKDTIKIGWKTDFYYNISGAYGKILSVKIYFEDKEIHNYQYYNYYQANGKVFFFNFDPSPYNNGNYNFYIQIITGSGTGSIADKLNAEGYLYTLTWPVYIDKTLPSGIYNYIISAKQTEKGIELTWPIFNHPNFIAYQVCRQYVFIQNNPVVIASFSQPLQNYFTDNTYWEGTDCIYYLRIRTPAGLFTGEYIWFTPSLGKFEAKLNNDRTIYVSWDPAKNPSSFGKYYIYFEDCYHTLIESQFIDDIKQTSTIFNPGSFHGDLSIYLKIIPPGVSEAYYKYLGYKMLSMYIP